MTLRLCTIFLFTWVCALTPHAAQAGMLLNFFMVTPERAEQLAHDPQALLEFVFNPAACDLNIQKAWHGVHYLLNGDAWSTSGKYGQVVLGGADVGPDTGYGPAHLLTAPEVKTIASLLKDLPAGQLRSRYDPAAMTKAQIYPFVDWTKDGSDTLEWLLTNYHKLAAFYAMAAAQGKAVIIAML